ncbi:uncharacterized protein BJ171DRAFT_512160, partial [Polychytrium aggregatum]|uniref:uncharacterized protein n=1 Tax=Polychytrium aggregatum TaxID=110093 RepID=UPI0022FDE998
SLILQCSRRLHRRQRPRTRQPRQPHRRLDPAPTHLQAPTSSFPTAHTLSRSRAHRRTKTSFQPCRSMPCRLTAPLVQLRTHQRIRPPTRFWPAAPAPPSIAPRSSRLAWSATASRPTTRARRSASTSRISSRRTRCLSRRTGPSASGSSSSRTRTRSCTTS